MSLLARERSRNQPFNAAEFAQQRKESVEHTTILVSSGALHYEVSMYNAMPPYGAQQQVETYTLTKTHLSTPTCEPAYLF